MSVIKNEDIKSNNSKSARYELPAVIRKEKGEIPFEKALLTAILLHPAAILLILLTSLILKFLGINFDLLNKPELKPKDIEFVLVDKEATPIDKNTKNRADKNSRAGGKHDPKRPVSLPQAAAPKGPAKKPTPPSEPKQAQPQKPKQQPVQPAKPAVKQPPATPKQTKPAQQPQQVKPTPIPPKPQAPTPQRPQAPKPSAKPPSNFNIPIPKSSIPQMAQPKSSPVTSAPSSKTGITGGSGKGASSPSPSFSPTTSSRGGASGSSGSAGGGGRFSGTYGNGGGNVGNPGPGNPKGAPGIDAIKEPDFGPYMKDLQRRIKMNWDPPKGNESKRVILLFSIARDGRLLNVSIHKSSGLPAADKAAIDAVKLTAPFRPLPPEFKGKSVDIQFTFDYNVFGVSG